MACVKTTGGPPPSSQSYVELLELIDARNDALVRRIVDCVDQTLHRHMETMNKIEAKGTPSSTVRFDAGTSRLSDSAAPGLSLIGEAASEKASDDKPDLPDGNSPSRNGDYLEKSRQTSRQVNKAIKGVSTNPATQEAETITPEAAQDSKPKGALQKPKANQERNDISAEEDIEPDANEENDEACPQEIVQSPSKQSNNEGDPRKGSRKEAYLKLQKWKTEGSMVEENTEENQLISVRHKLQLLVQSKRFDLVFCSFIVCNAVLMLAELEYNGRQSLEIIGLDEPGAQYSPGLESSFQVLNVFFACVFVIELTFRLVAFGHHFLKRALNWLDIIIVAGSVLDLVGTSVPVNLTFLRLIRLSKLARVLKVALMASFCEPLRILVSAVRTSAGYLFWSFMFLFMCMIGATLFINQIVAEAIVDENLDIDLRKFIYTYYGTTSRTFLSMFQITMAPGAWGVIGRPLVEDLHPAWALFFMVYVGGVSFSIVRIITALFLRKTLQVAIGDEQATKNRQVKKQHKASESIRDQWGAVDSKGKGRFSLPEFEDFLNGPIGKDWLRQLEIDEVEAVSIFELVRDANGLCTLDQYLSGFFRVTNATKPIDMVLLQVESKKISKIVGEIQRDMQELLCPGQDPEYLSEQGAFSWTVSKVLHRQRRSETTKSLRI